MATMSSGLQHKSSDGIASEEDKIGAQSTPETRAVFPIDPIREYGRRAIAFNDEVLEKILFERTFYLTLRAYDEIMERLPEKLQKHPPIMCDGCCVVRCFGRACDHDPDKLPDCLCYGTKTEDDESPVPEPSQNGRDSTPTANQCRMEEVD